MIGIILNLLGIALPITIILGIWNVFTFMVTLKLVCSLVLSIFIVLIIEHTAEK